MSSPSIDHDTIAATAQPRLSPALARWAIQTDDGVSLYWWPAIYAATAADARLVVRHLHRHHHGFAPTLVSPPVRLGDRQGDNAD